MYFTFGKPVPHLPDKSILGVKTWRLEKGISLDAISASTKIAVRLLEAIEVGDFKRLPGGIYNTNYIRQYARAIDFSEAKLLAYYHAVCSPAQQSSLMPQSAPQFS